jgi:RNA polymerase sigma factor (sigma-70 family)
MGCHTSNDSTGPAARFVTDAVARERPRYLAFVRRRVSDDALAEDILQDATLKALERAATLKEQPAFEGWFFRILRNAITDLRRRRGAETRGKDAFSAQAEHHEDAVERVGHACACVMPLMDGLKEEYRDALTSVEVEGQKVRDFATQQGISSSNAGVRVHRARAALKQQVETTCGVCAAAGCMDCCCG